MAAESNISQPLLTQSDKWWEAINYRFSNEKAWSDDMEIWGKLKKAASEGMRVFADSVKLELYGTRENIVRTMNGLLVIALLTACSFQKDQQPPQLPAVESQPRIGLINGTVAKGNTELQRQLQAVKTLSGRPGCQPQIVTVEDGKGKALADTFCRIENGTMMVSRHQEGSPAAVINQELKGYIQKDKDGKPWAVVLAYPDNSPDGVNPIMWVYLDSGESEWIFPDGMRVKFGSDQSPFRAMVKKIIAADSGLNQVQAAEPTVTPKPKETPPPIATATEVAQFSVEQGAPMPEGLGVPAIAVRWGPTGSFTVSTREGTSYGPLRSPVGERPIFDTPEGKEFFFGFLARAYGYDSSKAYLEAVTSGTAELVNVPKFGIQEGPLVVDPGKLSIVFEATEVNDPNPIWHADRIVREVTDTGGWIRYSASGTRQQRSYYKYEVQPDGRIIIRISNPEPSPYLYDRIGNQYYSALIVLGIFNMGSILTNNGDFPPPPEGFFGPSPFGRSAEYYADGTPIPSFWELLGVSPYLQDGDVYTGPADFH